MITLHQAPPIWGLPNISPACMKLETWFRLANIEYQVGDVDLANAPKGKVPWIDIDGRRIGDSTLIVEHLRGNGRDPDRRLSAAQRATALAFRRMLKENVYWLIIQIRYREDDNWRVYRELLSALLAPGAPEAEQSRVVEEFKQNMLRQMHGHGMARHTADEVYQLGAADLTAVSDYLGDKPYFLGAEPTTVDATIYAYAANVLLTPLRDPLAVRGFEWPNLRAHCERMANRFFPELATAQPAGGRA